MACDAPSYSAQWIRRLAQCPIGTMAGRFNRIHHFSKLAVPTIGQRIAAAQ